MPDLKPELSEKSKYWIPKHRYYELKHYCLQYLDWKKLYLQLDAELKAHQNCEVRSDDIYRNTEELAVKRAELDRAMQLIWSCSMNCTDEILLQEYIFKAVTEGFSYSQLQAKYNIPYGKDSYYDIYRRFFWLLSQRRGI